MHKCSGPKTQKENGSGPDFAVWPDRLRAVSASAAFRAYTKILDQATAPFAFKIALFSSGHVRLIGC